MSNPSIHLISVTVQALDIITSAAHVVHIVFGNWFGSSKWHILGRCVIYRRTPYNHTELADFTSKARKTANIWIRTDIKRLYSS